MSPLWRSAAASSTCRDYRCCETAVLPTITALGSFGGGGIFNDVGTLTFTNTIVANSFRGELASFGSSLVDDGGGTLDTDGTCVGRYPPDPLSGRCRNNGGPTQTLAIPWPVRHSARKCRKLPATDQRGVLRPQSSPATSARMSSLLPIALSCGAERDQHCYPPETKNSIRGYCAPPHALTRAPQFAQWQGTDGNHLKPLKSGGGVRSGQRRGVREATHLQKHRRQRDPGADVADALNT